MNYVDGNFNYSILDEQTVNFLKKKESNMREIVGKAYTELGRELKEAQDKLAGNNQYDGVFEKWYTSLGFKKSTVYDWIGRYDLLVQNPNNQEMLEELPVSLTVKISKPSTREELKQKVLDGDIKTLKEFRELELALKKTEQERDRLGEMLSIERKKEPKVIEKTVIPDHIHKRLKDDEYKIKHLKAGYEEMKDKLKEYELQNTQEFDEKQYEIQKKKLQYEADLTTINMRIAYKNFIEQGSVSSYVLGAITVANEAEKEHLNELVEMAERVIHDTKMALKGRKVGVVNE